VLELARGGLLYLETSALTEFVVDEAETGALRDELRRWGDRQFVTSALTRVELPRAVRRVTSHPAAPATVAMILSALRTYAVTDAVLSAAADVDPPLLRSLDAIHLATALAITDRSRRCAPTTAACSMPPARTIC
jgi:predicted nucleic acid-binding protein